VNKSITNVNKEKTVINLTGMTCTACAGRIEKSLQQAEGVLSAQVNFPMEKATLQKVSQKRMLTLPLRRSQLNIILE